MTTRKGKQTPMPRWQWWVMAFVILAEISAGTFLLVVSSNA